MRSAGWRKIVLIVVLAVIVLGGATGGVLVLLSHQHSRNVKTYQAVTSQDWREVAGSAGTVAAAMLRVTSAADLPAVAGSAGKMKELVDTTAARLEKNGPPSGYGDIGAKETTALASMSSYLKRVADDADKGSEADIRSDNQIVADLARKAQDDVNDFESSAKWVKVNVPGDFYSGSEALLAAYQPSQELDADRQQVYDTMQTFMTADIVHRNFDVIWSLLDSRLHTGFDYYKITEEKLAAGWDKAWDGKPTDFYVSRSQIAFPSPGNATVKVIAYMENAGPRIEEFRLVKEGGTWKLDDDPFVGFL